MYNTHIIKTTALKGFEDLKLLICQLYCFMAAQNVNIKNGNMPAYMKHTSTQTRSLISFHICILACATHTPGVWRVNMSFNLSVITEQETHTHGHTRGPAIMFKLSTSLLWIITSSRARKTLTDITWHQVLTCLCYLQNLFLLDLTMWTIKICIHNY